MQLENGFVIESRFSPWQKKNVRTILVNARAKTKQQRSINAAMDIAKPYDRIELTGGEYPEAITITFPVELVASEGEEPHIVSRNSGITITANVDVLLENLTVVSRSTSGKLDGAVVVMAGTPSIKHCTLSSVVVGGSARPALSDCTITSSASGFGLVVQDAGGGTVNRCTIRSHSAACVEIDTRGELLLADCTLANAGADVVVMSASNSSVPLTSSSLNGWGETGIQLLQCSGVTVRQNRIYVDHAPPGGSGGNSLVANTAGCPCCLIIGNGAAPTCEANEFMEGEIGIMLDGSGAAQLRGNMVRCQRRCGILALVEEGFAYGDGRDQSLRVSGDNVLDRCYIGIDVQCRGNQKDVFGVSPDGKLSNALPIAKRAFHWIAPGTVAGHPSTEPSRKDAEDATSTPFLFEGEIITPAAAKAALAKLLTRALQAHPTFLQPSFAAAVVGNASISSLTRPGSSPVADLLSTLMDVQLPADAAAAAAVEGGGDGGPPARSEAEHAAMLGLRGNRGIDVVKTKFSSCDLCAVRFGKQSYGLVEDCAFENCGTHAIVVEAAAHPLITGCRFSRSRGASIILANYAQPFVLGNEIASGQVHGIEVASMSRGIIAGNWISGNRGSGVHVGQMSSTIVCGNVVSQNRSAGVYVTEGSQPLLLANHFSGNAIANVFCTESADAMLAFNTILSSPEAGILFSNCSRGTAVGNDISANGDGIVLELDAEPIVRGNSIHENMRSGVLARNNALGTFVKNKLEGNSGPNFMCTEGAHPHVRQNEITGSANGGVVVVHEGRGHFEKNRIGENAVANVMVVNYHSEPTFEGNNISSSSSGCGVICAHGAGGLFVHNGIHDNKQAGVYVVEAAHPTFERNRISREAVGIIVSDCGKGVFVQNTVEGCFGTGVMSQREGEPLFERNSVTNSGMNGLLIAPDGLGRFFDNSFSENDVGVQLGSSLDGAALDLHSAYLSGGVDGSGAAPLSAGGAVDSRTSTGSAASSGENVAPSIGRPSPPAARRNTITGTGADRRRSSSFFSPTGDGRSALQDLTSAVEKRRTSTARSTACQVSRNSITRNRNGGVLLERQCNGIMEENDICDNGDYGIRGNISYSTKRAQAIVEERFALSGVSPVRSTVPHFASQRGGTGANSGAASSAREATLRRNRITRHVIANVAFESFTQENGEVKLEENDVHSAPIGILVTDGSSVPLAERNHIHHCMDGMYFEAGGGGDFAQNRISDCHLCGVYVCSDGDPHFLSGNVVERCQLCGVMVDAKGCGSFRNGSMRGCGLAGVIVFAGPTTPFHVSYEEVRQAGIISSTPTFEENCVEENETHGVLVLSVIGGSALRNPRSDARTYLEEGKVHFPVAPSAANAGGVGGGGMGGVVRGERLCAYFAQNTIRKNRLFGVFHDRFDHWDLGMIFGTLSPPATQGSLEALPRAARGATTPTTTTTTAYAPPTRLQQQQRRQSISTSPDRGIKNAYGGYEILLGTSQIGASSEHHRQRELKQVTFKENSISHSCVGFAAGYGCHPFLLRNTIVDNVFLGLLLRFGSAVVASHCEISRNGLAGIQAACGAKGFISKGVVKENNALCRPPGRPHESRDFDAILGDLAHPAHDGALAALDPAELEALSAREVVGLQRASEQLTQLASVHRATLGEAVRILWELASASSAGIAIASGCVPSSLSTAPPSGTSAAPAAAVGGGGGGGAANSGIGGLGVADYVRLCVADGGLGVWIEEGSRVTISENTIEGNAHAGVYFAAGVATQHRTLHKFFSMSGDGTGAITAAPSPTGAAPMGIGAIKATRNGVLAAGLALPNRKSSAQEREAAMLDLFGGNVLPYPQLATSHVAALFTSHSVCASGVMAAAAVTQRRSSQLSTSHFSADVSFRSLSTALPSMVFDDASGRGGPLASDRSSSVYDGLPPRPGSHGRAELQEEEGGGGRGGQRVDSIHCALVVENVITGNGEYGVFLEVTQVMKTDAAPATATANKAAQPGSASPPGNQLALLASDDAVMGSGDNLTAHLDFHIIVEGNTISRNARAGVFCQHVVDVHAHNYLPSRGALRDQVQQGYEAVRTGLVLGGGGGAGEEGAKERVPFVTRVVSQRTHRALLVGNEVMGNTAVQAEVTSRYVVSAGDGTRTLLQLDTLSDVAVSPFSSQVLTRIPVTAALLARPPTSLCVWEKNSFQDGRRGVRVCGYVGASSAQFQRNRFCNMSEDAVLVEGHLSSCTLGTGNVFQDCGVAVRVRTDTTRGHGDGAGTTEGPPPLAPAAKARPNDLRTRIFGNVFSRSTQSSVVVDCCAGEHVLLHGNDFSQHPYGSTALFLTNRATSGVLVHGNTFRDSFSPVVISATAGTFATGGGGGGGGSVAVSPRISSSAAYRGDGNSAATVRAHTLTENLFLKNFIGLLVCNGAAPRVLRSLFDSNLHTGLEVVGMSTHPVVESCVFRKHCRGVGEGAVVVQQQQQQHDTLGTLPPPSAAAMLFPANGTLSLFSASFSVDLVPGNSRLLSPNSQVCLPCGVLLGPFAECDISGSFFTGNDVGLDAARVVVPASLAISSSVAVVRDSVFHDNQVGGVLVRHPEDEHAQSGGMVHLQAPPRSKPAETRKEADTGNEPSSAPETTRVSGCLFVANSTSPDGTGDVISLKDGFAAFRNNFFFGTVHCKEGGASLFAANTFLSDPGTSDNTTATGDGDDEDDDAAVTSIMGRGARPATLSPALPAIILHNGARQRIEDNTIACRGKGLLVCPDAGGHARRNCFLACTTAITVAPFSHTTVAENRLLRCRDCGVIAYGGLVTSNEVYDSPTGIVLQPPSQYKGYNAIPAHKRSTTDTALCTRNTITACSGDGVLVAGSSKVEGNVVCKCQNGINVVCPSTMELAAAASGIAGLAGPPQVLANTVFDCGNGICMDKDSVGCVIDNDIFDNDYVGVLILANATGTLQNNSVSSPNEHGAVDIPPDCRVKTLGNVIRNQFSPAYNRTTRANRLKDHATKKEAIEEEVSASEVTLAGAVEHSATQYTRLSSLPDDIAKRLVASTAKVGGGGGGGIGGRGVAAGLASRALLRRSLDSALHADWSIEVEGEQEASATATPQPASLSPAAAAARAKSVAAADTGVKPTRRTSAGVRRSSQAAKQARKKAADVARTAAATAAAAAGRTERAASVPTDADTDFGKRDMGGSKRNRSASTTTAAPAGPRPVLIHVFAQAHVPGAHTAALSLGETVAGILASPPMSRMSLSAFITTSTTHLASTLRSQKAPPFIVIAIMDHNVKAGGAANASGIGRAFALLHEAARPTNAATATAQPKKGRKGVGQHLLYLVHPDTADTRGADDRDRPSATATATATVARDGPSSYEEGSATTDGESRMCMADFAKAADGVFTFHTGVEDALEPLREAMARDVAHPAAAPASRRQSVVVISSPRPAKELGAGEGGGGSGAATPTRKDAEGTKTKKNRPGSITGRAEPPTLSRERIGELLSKITPEALGYGSAPESTTAKKKKRRKSSATSVSGADGGGNTTAKRKSSLSAAAAAGGKAGRISSRGKSPVSGTRSPGAKKAKRASLASNSPEGLPPLAE